jgi:monoamine oxidase
VEIQPFVQLNHNALLHSSNAFDGRPQRIRHIRADFQGQIAELLAKVAEQAKLDEAVSADDKAILWTP